MIADAETKRPNGDRDERGRFRPGCAGGPGNPHVRRLAELQHAVREAVGPEEIKRVLAKLLELAGEGDVAACKVLLDRVLGRPAPAAEAAEGVAFDMPRVESVSDVAQAMQGVLAAVGRGTVSMAAAAGLVGMLDAQRRALEAAELEARVAQLEAEAQWGH